MSDTNPELPDATRPILDVRQLAAAASYARWLLAITEGQVSETQEAEYVRPKAQDFTTEQATMLMTSLYQWLFNQPEAGLLKRANYDPTRQLLGRAATLTGSLVGLDIASVQSLCAAFHEHGALCGQFYRDSTPRYADYGDMTFLTDGEITRHAASVLNDLVEPDVEGLKDTLHSGFVDNGWGDEAIWKTVQ